MTFEEIQELIAKDEHRCLELKKTTGELQDGMHSACAFLNTDCGGAIQVIVLGKLGVGRESYGGCLQGAGCAGAGV
ncbi:MAG: hypothetical protein J5932_03200 [Prevotella sp.]|nr:hypothetical protein [Prevotella sp.]MBP3844017.1 hypothetical protein [Prevotella sp.]